ncbi:family 43 glycosylhydrolase [Tunturibacter empetritectus]|uniref:Beta-xylosidase n=1 Tax=Tunturiibacter empetritectus TaxID=3069691 RepID=A0A7W8ILP2_9BACT|nr:family 43 glycosylhydrolase [Edaphobacter lichenicola]MBB5319426.1 beta-xylosidase [Edaphobacter lichenicola]
MITRRRFFRDASAASLAFSLTPGLRILSAEIPSSVYTNPIMGGDHPDASPIRVGNEFYLTHSSFDYAPGLLIWHSLDLVNWKPVAAALHGYYGSVWAPYLCEYQGHFYIYFPANNRLFVVHALHPTGPWSEPIDLGVSAIDPAHIAENGRRFLYTNGGQMLELTPDGLSVKSPSRPVFEPWPVPSSTRIECTCLEGPKLLANNGYFYLNVAEGGTGGPATSHSVISARSRHAEGPWEFSPYNPIIHTQSRDDRWLSLGHGRLVDTPDGKWYMTVHSYENGYRTLGRQLLLLPIVWTTDGWFREQPETGADSVLPMPVPGRSQQSFLDPSDQFVTAELGLQWGFWHQYDSTRFDTGKGYLRLNAKGKGLSDTSVLTASVGGHAYTVEVDVEIDPDCEAGLLLFYDPEHATGITLGPQDLSIRAGNGLVFNHSLANPTRATLRIVNDRQEIDFYFRLLDQPWQRTQESAEISGMHHNILGGFLDVRPALSAWGTGCATFRNFRFWPQINLPT